ncbi:MAG: hypothetical protein JXB88_18125 [Spirochaetales bacterium]|nr:hypothetical protein [Spirochaetales bacterium]
MSRKTFMVKSYEITHARRMTIGTGAVAFGSVILCRGSDGTRFALYFLNPPSEVPDNIYNPDAKWATSYLPGVQFPWYQDILRNEKPVYAYLNSNNPAVNGLYTTSERIGESEEVPSLEAWLSAHSQVRNALIWEDSSGTHPYINWSAARKNDLIEAFEAAWFAAPDDLVDPLPNEVTLTNDQSITQVLSPDNAWKLYLAYTAHSLAIEISDAVAWSISGYSAENLATLFDSRKFFVWENSYSGYRFDFWSGVALPAPPRYTYNFLIGEDLISYNHFETIGRLLDWCRFNLIHFSGGWETGNIEKQWQYRGFPPVSCIIEGTLNTGHPEWGIAHRTAGCHGTLGFLRVVLRCINIPVRPNYICSHALPHFPTVNQYMSHGDDPYNALSKGTPPPFPATNLMITATKYNEWFGNGVNNEKKCDNVGRNVRELALIHLPPYLLHKHCEDLAYGRNHAESGVAEIFSREYTVAELEVMDLWNRIQAKIDGYGGCANIP